MIRPRFPRFRRLCRMLCLLLPATLLPRPAAAADPPAEPCSLCWRGRPAEYCKSFLITELGIGTRLKSYAGRSPYDDHDIYLVASLGLLRNLGSRNALGGTLNLDSELRLLSVTPRYRRWLSDLFAADASAGINLGSVGTSFDTENIGGIGFRADLSATLADVVSLGGGMELTPGRGADNDVAWHLESRLGSYPAAIGAGGLLVAAAAFIAVLAFSGWD